MCGVCVCGVYERCASVYHVGPELPAVASCSVGSCAPEQLVFFLLYLKRVVTAVGEVRWSEHGRASVHRVAKVVRGLLDSQGKKRCLMQLECRGRRGLNEVSGQESMEGSRRVGRGSWIEQGEGTVGERETKEEREDGNGDGNEREEEERRRGEG